MSWARSRVHSPPIGTYVSRRDCLTRRWHRGFRHDWLGSVAARAAQDEAFVARLQDVERNTPLFPDGQALTRATLGIDAPADVTAMIKEKVRHHASVILNATSDGPFARSASLLNRFIVAELVKLGVIVYRPGPIDLSAIKSNNNRFEVAIDGAIETVDLVVVRHGPKVRPLASFAEIDSALLPARSFLRTYRAGVDRTRTRAWAPVPVVRATGGTTLPPSAEDVMEYIGRSLQDAVKDEFSRRGMPAAVGRECSTSAATLRVRIGSREQTLVVALASTTRVNISHGGSATAAKTIVVALGTDVMTDPGSAVPMLVAKVPEMIGWIESENP